MVARAAAALAPAVGWPTPPGDELPLGVGVADGVGVGVMDDDGDPELVGDGDPLWLRDVVGDGDRDDPPEGPGSVMHA